MKLENIVKEFNSVRYIEMNDVKLFCLENKNFKIGNIFI